MSPLRQQIIQLSKELAATPFLVKGIKIILILAAMRLILSFGYFFIDSAFGERERRKFLDPKKSNTLKVLLKSILRYATYFFGGTTILSLFVPVGSILAAAGIGGLALGFGAQSLVRDVITGFFILFEDQFAVGDYITTAGVSGMVEEMGLRITRLRDFSGELHILPNGEITKVTNHSRGSMAAMVDVGIAYEADLERAMQVLHEVCEEMARDFRDVITEGPSVLGIVKLGESEVLIRLLGKTAPMEQWRIERELRRRVKLALDREGIEIPYPRRVLIARREDQSKERGENE